MARFRTKNNSTLIIIVSVLIAVLVVGVISYATKGWTDFSFTRDRNEDNLLLGAYDEFDTKKLSSGIVVTNDNDILIFEGEFAKSDSVSSEKIKYAELELEAGTYTYTCFNEEKPTMNSYYSYISWKDSSNGEHIVFADFDETNVTISGATIEGCKTFTISEKTTVGFWIEICSGTDMDNIEALPCLVVGEDVGNFYAE